MNPGQKSARSGSLVPGTACHTIEKERTLRTSGKFLALLATVLCFALTYSPALTALSAAERDRSTQRDGDDRDRDNGHRERHEKRCEDRDRDDRDHDREVSEHDFDKDR